MDGKRVFSSGLFNSAIIIIYIARHHHQYEYL